MGQLSHLDELEAEAIYIIREVAAECEKPVMLYSIGKDSSVMLHLAMKAFYPEKPPFPFLHVNTTWKFKEMIEFRDKTAKDLGIEMLEYINQDGVKQGINPFDSGSAYTDIMKTQALKQALKKYGFTAAFGGGRRDEEKSRAKERIFSFRNAEQAWDPKNQRPEMWKLYNTEINKGESIRVFPISNWTETDIWQYIKRENIPIVPLYFAKERPIVYRDGNIIMVDDDRMRLLPGEEIQYKSVRFRTLGCYPLTGGTESTATTLDEIIDETLSAVSSERTTRVIDNEAAGSMERRKREGWGGFVFRSQKFFEAVCRVGRFPGGVPLCTVGNDCGAGGAFQDLADFCPAVHDRLFFQKGVGSAVGALDGITGFHFAFPEFFFPLPPSSRRSEDFFGTLCFSG